MLTPAPTVIHPCPRCEYRTTNRAKLRDHTRTAHKAPTVFVRRARRKSACPSCSHVVLPGQGIMYVATRGWAHILGECAECPLEDEGGPCR